MTVPAPLQLGQGVTAPSDLLGQSGADQHVGEQRHERRQGQQQVEAERAKPVDGEGDQQAGPGQGHREQQDAGDPARRHPHEGDPPPQVCQTGPASDQRGHHDPGDGRAEGEGEEQQVWREPGVDVTAEEVEEVGRVGLVRQPDALIPGEEVSG